MLTLSLLLAAGLAVGLILGLTGAGGSIIAVPLLMALLHWSPQQAAPVALLAVVVASAFGSFEAWRRGLVRYRAATLMALAGIALTPLGVVLAQRLPQRWLLGAFAFVIVLVALRLILQARRAPADASVAGAALAGDAGNAVCRLDPQSGRIRWNSPCAGVLAATGALAGLLSGLLGIGGGFVIVPTLRRVTELSMQGAVATSLMVMALVGSGAITSMLAQGAQLPWQVMLPFVGGALAGMMLGRTLAPRLAGPRLQSGFGMLLFLIAGLMLWRAFQGA